MVTPNMEAPKPTPSSLAPLRPTAALRCASDHGCLPAGTTCGDTNADSALRKRPPQLTDVLQSQHSRPEKPVQSRCRFAKVSAGVHEQLLR